MSITFFLFGNEEITVVLLAKPLMGINVDVACIDINKTNFMLCSVMEFSSGIESQCLFSVVHNKINEHLIKET